MIIMKLYLRFTHVLTLSFSIIALSACSSGSTTTQIGESPDLFESCEDAPELDCGAFDVPLIHDSTDNRQLSIEVARLPGTGDGPHEPLLLIEGGPGSGTQVLREFAQADLISPEIRERYDIIGFDHRGVGSSLRVDCDQLGNVESIPYPRDQGDVMTLVTDFTTLADACSAQYDDQLQWVGSNAVVQDMEVLRTMLNAPKLNIISTSFGTRITALYLERFPEASGRIIMDAPLPPNGNVGAFPLDTAAAQQGNFDLILSACGTELPDCDPASVEAVFVARVNSLLDDGDLDTFNAFFELLTAAINQLEFGQLIAPLLIDYAFSGDPTDMFMLIQNIGLGEEEQDGDQNDSLTQERAVLCADDASRPSVESLLTELESLNESSDFFGEAVLPVAASCAGWPESLDPVADIRTTDAPASLVIGGTGDVLTPINWAVETADATGGVFLSSDHQGHTTIFSSDNDCVESIVVDFLLDGTLPPIGTSCR